MNYQKKRQLAIVTTVAALVIAAAAAGWFARHDIVRLLERSTLPAPVEYQEINDQATLPETEPAAEPTPQPTTTPAPTPTPTPTPTPKPPATTAFPAAINLKVPFTSQAPHGNWEQPYKDFCEEASVLMAMAYVQGFAIPSANFADQKMLEIKAFEDSRFGYYRDTDAEDTATIIREFYKYDQVKILPNPTVADIKQALAAGRLVIVPAAGRLLGNPYYTPPGPLYHMFVIKGYTTDGRFITHDPGTRRGADFLYKESTVMNAIHDWRPDGQIESGRKVVLIIG